MKTAFVYSTDENYVKPTAVSACSLLKHNPAAEIVVLACGVTAESAAFLERVVSEHGGTLALLDVADRLRDVAALGAGRYVSFSAYARLFIPQLLSGRFDRAVYIDGDTLVTDALGGLVALDLGGRPFAIGYDCIHNAYKKLVGIPAEAPYFNSGVLVMDLAVWSDRRCSERVFDYMKNVRHDLMFGDQDYFSLVLAEDAAILPPRYNFLTHYQVFRRARDARFVMDTPAACWYDDASFAAAENAPAIHHFLGNMLGRPWYRESANPLRPLYRACAAEAGVPEFAEQSRPLDLCYRIQELCRKTLPRWLFLRVSRAMYRYFFKTRYGV